MRTALVMVAALAACGEDSKSPTVDAPPQTDAAVDAPIDSSPNMTALDCPSYCGAIMSACTGTLAQYLNMQNCLDSCSAFTTGTAGTMTGNSLACRVAHVDLAKTSPSVHCEHAGPAGGGGCGAICEGFCSIVTSKCATQWPSASNCAAMCSNFTTTPPYKAPSTGNTAQCRLYHATMAATQPAVHCDHTLAVSTTCN